ncbi:MAG: KEOPS complex Pcc1-like subunit [Thermoplasmata archaeon]|nr:KEOPS complex Pcc1-like subunit [Thermoplasmata archaeon]
MRGAWVATIEVRRPSAVSAERLHAALTPEAGREVPRSTATIARHGALVTLRLVAADTGALRAAVNTFLGWVDLATRSEELVGVEPVPRASVD